jgi:DNA-directed RNA polymerase specialized sigma24 family protein
MISDEQLIAKYGRFCDYMGWQFIKRASMQEDSSYLQHADKEDFASAARYYLIRIPQKYRDQPFYIKRTIVNAIISARDKRRREFGRETSHDETYFDTLPGRDGLADYVQVNSDCTKLVALIPNLHISERLVVELHYGINGCSPCSPEQVARKLGRTRTWVVKRLESAHTNLRALIEQRSAITS